MEENMTFQGNVLDTINRQRIWHTVLLVHFSIRQKARQGSVEQKTMSIIIFISMFALKRHVYVVRRVDATYTVSPSYSHMPNK